LLSNESVVQQESTDAFRKFSQPYHSRYFVPDGKPLGFIAKQDSNSILYGGSLSAIPVTRHAEVNWLG
jgi:hypothetical protein